jgi:metal-sulfur cluster biosynthetic enzyme
MTEPTRDDVLAALRRVVDPEIGVNVVVLGRVYEAEVREGRVHVVMTMTTPACPLGESIVDEVAASIRERVHGVDSVDVELVSEPRWQSSMMSVAARERFGWR